KRAADDRRDAPTHQRLRRMLSRRPTAKILPDDQHRSALVSRRIERMLRILLSRILERVLPHRFERHFLQKPRRNNPVGCAGVTGKGNRTAGDWRTVVVRRGAHRRISLTSATAPLIAAAATMAGLINRVRPVGLPWRPMKLRLLDEALISRPTS